MRYGLVLSAAVVMGCGGAWADIPAKNCAELWHLTEQARDRAFAEANAFADAAPPLFGDREGLSAPETLAWGSPAYMAIATVDLWRDFEGKLNAVCPKPGWEPS